MLSNDTEILDFVDENPPGTKFKIIYSDKELSYNDGVYVIVKNLGAIPQGKEPFRGWSNHLYNTRQTKQFYKVHDGGKRSKKTCSKKFQKKTQSRQQKRQKDSSPLIRKKLISKSQYVYETT